MKLLVINNLTSGYQDGAIYDFLRAFTQDGDDVTIRSVGGDTEISNLLHDAEDYDAVVASGGDGTVAAVSYYLAETGIPILPFPAGTANLLSMNLAAPDEPHTLAKMLRNFTLMDFDLGVLETSSGEQLGFSIMAGAGYDAALMQNAEPTKQFLGPLAYFTAAFANLTPTRSQLKLTMDGKTVETEGLGVILANFSRIQFDIPVLHENLPRDGEFDVIVITTRDAFGLIPVLFSCMLDRTGSSPTRPDGLEIYRASSVYVEADPPLTIQYDGEVTEFMTPFSAHVIPEGARFVVSDQALKLYGGVADKPLAL